MASQKPEPLFRNVEVWQPTDKVTATILQVAASRHRQLRRMRDACEQSNHVEVMRIARILVGLDDDEAC